MLHRPRPDTSRVHHLPGAQARSACRSCPSIADWAIFASWFFGSPLDELCYPLTSRAITQLHVGESRRGRTIAVPLLARKFGPQRQQIRPTPGIFGKASRPQVGLHRTSLKTAPTTYG